MIRIVLTSMILGWIINVMFRALIAVNSEDAKISDSAIAKLAGWILGALFMAGIWYIDSIIRGMQS